MTGWSYNLSPAVPRFAALNELPGQTWNAVKNFGRVRRPGRGTPVHSAVGSGNQVTIVRRAGNIRHLAGTHVVWWLKLKGGSTVVQADEFPFRHGLPSSGPFESLP